MRYIFILFVLILASCESEQPLCVTDIKFHRHQALIPPTVTVKFRDKESIIEKSITSQTFQTLFFYGFEQEVRMQGYMKPGQYKRTGDTTELYIGINYFEALDKRAWDNKKVENFLIKGGIGLVIGNDTLRVQKCNK